MVYYHSKRSGYSYRKRHYNGRLSNKYIYGHKGSRSQANQIAALRNKINWLQQITRPEVKVHHSDLFSGTLTNGTFASSYVAHHYEWPSVGASDSERVGDTIRLKNLQCNITLEYYNNTTTPVHNGESHGTPIRIIALRTKAAESWSEPALNAILSYSSHQGDEYTHRAVSPFVHGMSEKYAVLYDKVIYMNNMYNQKVLRLDLPGGLITWTSASTCEQYFVYIVPAGLHADANFTETISYTMAFKSAYTDV